MNKQEKSEYDSILRQTNKIIAFQYYSHGSMKCRNCGFDDIDALSIDHINNGGTKERKSIKKFGSHFYKWLQDNNFPDGYQVLCMRCQFLKMLDKTNKK